MNSREKGARFERTLAAELREYGYDVHRTVQYCGKSDDSADLRGLPGIHIEAKHYKDVGFKYEWLDQAISDAKGQKIPAVFHKTNGKPIVVTLLLDDFMKIYNESSYADGDERNG